MHLLTRVCLQNWYLVDAIDVEIVGATALVGPTGAGKSSFADAIQTVITGANMNRLNLNPSASGKSARSVLEYCLGLTKDPAEGGEPLRQSCETVIALVFRDEETAEPLTVGIAMSARSGDSREEVLSRFVVPNYAYSVGEAKRRGDGGETLAPWTEIAAHMRRMSPDFEEYRTSAEKFTTDMLRRMRGFHNQAPNARHFLRAFSNALAFKPIFDSTLFVREFILEPDVLDIGRVRASIETWKQLEAVIEQIEAKLMRVRRLENRFGSWAAARLKAGETRFLAAQADMRRSVVELADTVRATRAKTSELSQTQQSLATRRQWIAEYDDEIRSKRMQADAGDAGARLRHLESERKYEDRENLARDDRYRKMRNAVSMVARLLPVADELTPKQRRAIVAAGEALRLMPESVPVADALYGKGEKLQSLVDEMLASSGLDDFLNVRADQLSESARETQARVERLESVVGQGNSERAILSTGTTRLMAALDRKGMAPVPLCDVVDVVDESWREAVESLLGWGREALIVAPENLRAAHAVMQGSRDIFGGCTLVRTNWTPSKRTAVPKGSVLEAVVSDDDHAMEFLHTRLAGFLKAEDEEALSRLKRGVMRDGKYSSGGGLSVQRPLQEFILGKAARVRTGETLRNELAPLLASLNLARDRIRQLREAARILSPALDTLRDGETLFDLEHSSRAAAQRLARLSDDMKSGDAADGAALLAEIASMEADRKAHVEEIATEYQPKVEALLKEAARAEAKQQVAREAARKAMKERKAAMRELSSPAMVQLVAMSNDAAALDPKAVLGRTRRAFRDAEFERDNMKSYLAGFANDNRALATIADRDAAREQSNAIREIAEYSANWDIDVPKVDSESMAEGYRWVFAERQRLEGNELRRYREECIDAGNEMRRMLKEDLLARLAEKLGKVHHTLELLNARLAPRVFTGQTYSFTSAVNGRFARMYDLAMSIGLNDPQSGSFDESLNEALAELEDLIEGKEGAGLLADYRQYFNFEIVMTDRAGGRTTMTSRSVKGSGGEAQAPFYVAMAASLAAAYYPGHSDGTPTGMGLAMFDEAFNKLDVKNTQALLTFFRDMGLQIMIAGPEDKRATYTEVLDTIVLVNKSIDGQSVYIDAEHPMALAKSALALANPEHKGMDWYRDAAL